MCEQAQKQVRDRPVGGSGACLALARQPNMGCPCCKHMKAVLGRQCCALLVRRKLHLYPVLLFTGEVFYSSSPPGMVHCRELSGPGLFLFRQYT